MRLITRSETPALGIGLLFGFYKMPPFTEGPLASGPGSIFTSSRVVADR